MPPAEPSQEPHTRNNENPSQASSEARQLAGQGAAREPESSSGGRRPMPRLLLWILAFGFLLRLLSAYYPPDELEVFRDSHHYFSIAKSLVDAFEYRDSVGHFLGTQPLFSDVGPTSFYLPGYPFFLAGIFAIFGESFRAVYVVQAFLSTFTILLCYASADRMFDHRMALVAAFLQAINIYNIHQVGHLTSENLGYLLVLLIYYLFVRTQTGPASQSSQPTIILLALTLGVGILTRSVFVPIAIAMGLYLAVARYLTTRSVVASLRELSLLVVIMTLCVSPWLIRNDHVWNRLIYNTKSGLVLFIAYNDNATTHDGHSRVLPRLEQAEFNELERHNYLNARAREWIRSHPMKSVHLIATRFVNFWNPMPGKTQGARRWVGAIWSTFFLSLALIGMLRLLFDFRRYAYFFVIPLAYVATHILTLSLTRYRLSLEGLLSIAVAVGLCFIYDSFSSSRTAKQTRH